MATQRGAGRLSPSPIAANVESPLGGPTHSDEDLEQEWRGGSRQAFAELFRRHYSGVVAYARRFTLDVSLAEDVVQQAFLNVFQRRSGSGRFKSLIYTVTRNLALNERRRRGRRYVAKTGLGESDPAGAQPQPVRQLITGEEQRGFERALAALPEDLREALCLKETRGLTYAEVGTIMGLHPDAVRRRVGKALSRIRQALKSGSLL